ncbi:META domain-containing protein [Paenarthrobacter ilicis]|uniref:META domain-containing protein n=1 Tax=Paenarthrobacter ilicis TaxID=43665 RepID=UPI00386B3525
MMTASRMRRARITSLALFFGVALAGCAGSGSSPFVGVWGEPGNLQEPSLDLHTDGSISGTDGCNRLMGSWKEEAKTATFGLASTRMACPGIDAWLSGAATARIQEDGKLAVFGQDGQQIGTLDAGK